MKKVVKKGAKRLDENLYARKKIFGIGLIMISLVMIYYGFSLGFETSSSGRFILGGLFVFVLAIALFKDKVNTKPMGLALLIYLILDVLLFILGSPSLSPNLIIEIVLVMVVVYFVFLKRNKK